MLQGYKSLFLKFWFNGEKKKKLLLMVCMHFTMLNETYWGNSAVQIYLQLWALWEMGEHEKNDLKNS